MDNIRIVLSRPMGSANVGAVCRAMRNGGFSNLAIVGSEDLNEDEIRRFSLHAWDVYENALRVPTLQEALEDTVFSAGTTRRTGKYRKPVSFLPEEFAERAWSLEGTVAVVFGNEESGLSADELDLCTAAVHIPTSEEYPSLNLSHAVQIMTYELYRSSLGERARGLTPANQSVRDGSIRKVCDGLDQAGFFSHPPRSQVEARLGEIFGRAGLSVQETRWFENFLLKILHTSDRNI